MKKHAKSYARINAMKGLYTLKLVKDEQQLNTINDPLAIEIIKNVLDNEEEINSYIKKYLKRWSIGELNPVNLAVLQICILEIMQKKTPINIIISEALSMSLEYGNTKDKNYIHFVLDNVSKDINE